VRLRPSTGRRGKEFIKPVECGDLFDEIDFAFHFGAPKRVGCIPTRPGREPSAPRFLIDADGAKPRALRLDSFACRNVGTHYAEKFAAG